MSMKVVSLSLFLFGFCFGSSLRRDDTVSNMNGEYLLSNSHPNGKWDSNYAKFGEVEYMDVYSPLISSQYSEVYWTMMDPVPLDPAVVDKFKGKIMAVVGYETDQVIKSPGGDVSVPIIHAYNHHYCAYMSGALSEMKQVTGDLGVEDRGMNNHGAPAWWQTFMKEGVSDAASDSGVPTSQFYSEGNGGEFRKSYHGYPSGYAQLIESPEFFHIQPMQIDTKNRHYNGTDFKPDLLPKVSYIPSSEFINKKSMIFSSGLWCSRGCCLQRSAGVSLHRPDCQED